MHRRTQTKRPVISAPIGPVTHLNGSGFTGTDVLQGRAWVDYCEGNRSYTTCYPGSSSDSIASLKSRRVSKSFPITQPPSASPTVVESDVSALSRIQTNNSSKASLGKKSASFLSLSRRSSSKYILEARPESADNAENIPPLKGLKNDQDSSIPRSMRKWHKSKTLTVLQELKKPFSRKSLAAVQGLNPDHPTPAPSPKINSRPSSPDDSSPREKVVTSQAVAFWTGIFTARRDRYYSERLNHGSSNTSLSASHNTRGHRQTRLPLPACPPSASSGRLTHLPLSKTISVGPTVTYDSSPLDDKEVDRHILKNMELMCATPAARKSFQLFEDYYALAQLKKLSSDQSTTYDEDENNELSAGGGNSFKSDERRRQPKTKGLTSSRSGAIGITPGRSVAAC